MLTVRVLCAALLVGAAWTVPATGAAADGCPLVAVDVGDGEVEYVAQCPPEESETGPVGGDGGSGGGPSCDLSTVEHVADYPYCVGTTACAVNNPSTLPLDRWPMDEQPSPEHIFTFTWCETASGEVDYYWSWFLPEETGPSLAELAQQAFGQLVTPSYQVGFNPPGRALVNVPTWFWAQTSAGGVITGTSALGVVAIGEPSHLLVDPGDGGEVFTCGFTTVESQGCEHTYRRSSAGGTGEVDGVPAFTARMRLVYDVRFEDDGVPLEVPGLPDTLESPWQSTAIPVMEIQSVVVY